METFSSFRKLWGRIEQDLEPNVYIIEVVDSKIILFYLLLLIFLLDYNIEFFSSNKSLLISTSSLLGQTSFIGWVFVVGACYLLFVIIFLISFSIANYNRKFDYSYMKWS